MACGGRASDPAEGKRRGLAGGTLDGGPVLNTALLTVGSGYTFEQAVGDRTFWGRLVESAVGAHLFNQSSPGMVGRASASAEGRRPGRPEALPRR